eukprot:gene10246-10404_t
MDNDSSDTPHYHGEINLRMPQGMTGLEADVLSILNLPDNLANLKSIKSFEHVLQAAQQQQLRQLRRLQQLKKQTELMAAQQVARQQNELAEQERAGKRLVEASMEAAAKAAQALELQAKRKAAQQTVARMEEDRRKKLEEKLSKPTPQLDAAVLDYERRVSAAKSAARQQTTQARKEQALEIKRAAVLAAEAAAQRRMQHKHELRLLQEAIKREGDSIAEEHRKQIQARAAADEAAKCAYYDAKHAHREQRLQQRQQELQRMRSLKAENSRTRFDYIRSRAEAVNEEDTAKREGLASKLQDKLARAKTLAEEREALAAHLTKTLAAQEQRIQQAVDKMVSTGNPEVPSDLLALMTITEEQARHTHSNSPASLGSSGKGSHSPRGTNATRSSPASAPGACKLPLPRTTVSVGTASGAAAQRQRQQEATLQQVLEEEILHEMERERLLEAAVDQEDHKALVEKFALDREAAKARIRQASIQLLPPQGVNKSAACGADSEFAPATATDAAGSCSAADTCGSDMETCQS